MLGFLLLRLAEHHVLPTDTRQRTRNLFTSSNDYPVNYADQSA